MTAKKTKKVTAASIAGLVSESLPKPTLTTLPTLCAVPKSLRGKVLTAELVIPLAGGLWHTDMFVKVGDEIYHVGSTRISGTNSTFKLSENGSAAERAAYAKLRGVPIKVLDDLAKKMREEAKSEAAASDLARLKAQAEAKGYTLTKKRAPKPPATTRS